jgi:hypothetical protein
MGGSVGRELAQYIDHAVEAAARDSPSRRATGGWAGAPAEPPQQPTKRPRSRWNRGRCALSIC